MAWVGVNRYGDEYIYESKPNRHVQEMYIRGDDFFMMVQVPKGTIKKLIGRELTCYDEAVHLEEE